MDGVQGVDSKLRMCNFEQTSCIKVVLFSPLCFFVVHVVSAKKRINEADKEMELSKGKVFVVVGGVVVEHMQYER